MKFKNPFANYKILSTNIFSFLQAFCSKEIIQIKERKTDEHGFFSKEGNRTKMLDIIENFIILDKEEGKFTLFPRSTTDIIIAEVFNIKSAQVSLDEIPYLMEFWFKNDPNVYVEDVANKKAKEKLKELEKAKEAKFNSPPSESKLLEVFSLINSGN